MKFSGRTMVGIMGNYSLNPRAVGGYYPVVGATQSELDRMKLAGLNVAQQIQQKIAAYSPTTIATIKAPEWPKDFINFTESIKAEILKLTTPAYGCFLNSATAEESNLVIRAYRNLIGRANQVMLNKALNIDPKTRFDRVRWLSDDYRKFFKEIRRKAASCNLPALEKLASTQAAPVVPIPPKAVPDPRGTTPSKYPRNTVKVSEARDRVLRMFMEIFRCDPEEEHLNYEAGLYVQRSAAGKDAYTILKNAYRSNPTSYVKNCKQFKSPKKIAPPKPVFECPTGTYAAEDSSAVSSYKRAGYYNVIQNCWGPYCPQRSIRARTSAAEAAFRNARWKEEKRYPGCFKPPR